MDQHPLPEIEPYVNRNLFSDHFLRIVLPGREAWEADQDKVKLAMQAVTNLYAGREDEWSSSNEAQLEDKLIRLALQALDHHFEVQPSLPTPDTVTRPDYAFFRTDEERRRAKKEHEGEVEYFNKTIAIGDAKRWDRPLDKGERGSRDKFDRLSPSWQMDYYLRMSGVTWGILTNGRLWRLYNQDTSFRLDICYEIDLPRLLATKDLEAFKYFYLFFTRQAFVPDAEGLCFLDRVYQGSLEYAQAVGGDLKENVYKALRLLAEGFLHTQGNSLDPVHDLEEIHANSLVLLYRLLFINYAEDRSLLPRDNPLYKDSYGLASMKREIASRLQRGDSLSPLHTTYWGKLNTLFQLINRGTEGLGVEAETMDVPPYNGGLFDPEKHPFLEQHEVADKWVSQVVDLLARSQGEGVGRGFVDYSSLDVRHLGSIYEGLLEYKLRVADQEMVALKRGGKEEWIPAAEGEGSRVLERVQPGSVYLATDRGERKATGSYYTPDYIVKYIVEHTVGPLIQEKMEEDDPIESILSLKVLDPAMGSGHFLVEATDRLAHALVEALGVTEEEPEEEDIRWARREVVERCIYGVDLNPLAVELSKLSLWLHTVAEGKPLNFLDHHLKVGNSLIGAWVDELGSLPVARQSRAATGAEPDARQMNFFETRLDERLPVMLNKVLEIIRGRSDTLEDIKAKTAADQAVEQLKAPFNAVADLWVSTYFGNALTKTEYQEALEHIGDPGRLLALPPVNQAVQIAEEKRFFHWELEFPEVFYQDSNKRQRPGFDVVLGNPPYAQKEPFGGQERGYFQSAYPTARSNMNLAALFMRVALRLTRSAGFHGFIVPKSLTFVKAWHADRQLLGGLLEAVCDVSRAWREVLLEQVVYVARLPRRRCHLEAVTAGSAGDLTPLGTVDEALIESLDVIPCYLDESRSALWRRLTDNAGRISSLVEFTVGTPLQSMLLPAGPYPAIGGDSIGRFQLYEPKGYFGAAFQDKDPQIFALRGREKLVVQRIVAHIENPFDHIQVMAAVDPGDFIPVNTLVVLLPKRVARDLAFLLALLNSRFASWFYYYYVFNKAIRSMDMYEYYLNKLPLPAINRPTGPREIERMSARGLQLSGSWLGPARPSPSREPFGAFVGCELDVWLQARLASSGSHPDVVHNVLGHLADSMVQMHKDKQREGRAFVDWLVDYTGLSIEEWRLNSIVKAYWEQGWDELQRALRGNRKTIEKASGRDVEGREAQEAIQGEFEKSMTNLDPLLERIASTDRLIDLIVYRLYGLTEEEVAIVEESATR